MAGNVPWLAEVGDLVRPNFQQTTDHKSTKQCVKSRPKPQFLQTAVGRRFFLHLICEIKI